MKTNKYSLVTFKLLVSSFLIYLIFINVPFNMVAKTIANGNYFLLFCALLSNILSLFFSSLRSKLYFANHGFSLKIKDAASIYYIGAMFNTILPSGIGGDAYKIFLFSRLYNCSKLKSFRIILYERANGLYPLCVLSLVLLIYTPFYDINIFIKYIIIASIILVTPCYFLGAKYILMDKIATACKALPLSLIVQLLQIASAVLAIYSIDFNVSYENLKVYLVIFLISSIISIIPISIGGIGIRELCFLEGSRLIDTANQDVAVSIGIAIFIITIFTSIVSIPIWIKYKVKTQYFRNIG